MIVQRKLTNISRFLPLATGPFGLRRVVKGRDAFGIACNLFRIRPLLRPLPISSDSSNNDPVSRNLATSLRTSDFLGSLTSGYFCTKATQNSGNDLYFMYFSSINTLCSSVYFIMKTITQKLYDTSITELA